MQDFVPEDVTALIAAIEAKQDAQFQARKRSEDAELERLKKIQALRDARAGELQAACVTIGGWIQQFTQTIGPAVWRLESGVVIFIAKFWRGEPAPPGDRRTWAQLRIGSPDTKLTDRLVYEEVHAGPPGQSVHSTPLLFVPNIWQLTHPDFVVQCAAHLSGPDAWKYVRQTLERLKK